MHLSIKPLFKKENISPLSQNCEKICKMHDIFLIYFDY